MRMSNELDDGGVTFVQKGQFERKKRRIITRGWFFGKQFALIIRFLINL